MTPRGHRSYSKTFSYDEATDNATPQESSVSALREGLLESFWSEDPHACAQAGIAASSGGGGGGGRAGTAEIPTEPTAKPYARDRTQDPRGAWSSRCRCTSLQSVLDGSAATVPAARRSPGHVWRTSRNDWPVQLPARCLWCGRRPRRACPVGSRPRQAACTTATTPHRPTRRSPSRSPNGHPAPDPRSRHRPTASRNATPQCLGSFHRSHARGCTRCSTVPASPCDCGAYCWGPSTPGCDTP